MTKFIGINYYFIGLIKKVIAVPLFTLITESNQFQYSFLYLLFGIQFLIGLIFRPSKFGIINFFRSVSDFLILCQIFTFQFADQHYNDLNSSVSDEKLEEAANTWHKIGIWGFAFQLTFVIINAILYMIRTVITIQTFRNSR